MFALPGAPTALLHSVESDLISHTGPSLCVLSVVFPVHCSLSPSEQALLDCLSVQHTPSHKSLVLSFHCPSVAGLTVL